jgi:anti-anti-sigma factor
MAAHSPLPQPQPQPQPGSVALVASRAQVRLVLAGELDLATKAELLQAVREAVRYDQPVEVDTRQVTFMDSSAIAALSRLIQQSDHRPIFVSPPDVVRFLLDVTHIGELVDVVERDVEPVTAVRRGSPVTTSA